MDRKIYYHRYELESAAELNVKSRRMVHPGILIRVDGGFACIHPWEVFGDEPVEVQLSELARGTPTRLGRRAIEVAKLDRDARRKGESLFAGLEVPDSHGTSVAGVAEVGRLVSQGFDTVKLKAGFAVEDDATMIREISAAFPDLRLRIDFNCNFLGSQVVEFIRLLPREVRSRIDFLEDPCAYGDACWTGLRDLLGLQLAVDIGVEKVSATYSYSIIKPAKNQTKKVAYQAMKNARKCVVTSYMDHPLGQAYAAYQAALVERDFPGISAKAGLMTHGLFRPNAFTEALGEVKPKWSFRAGTGLGFDELLESVAWKKLIY